MTFRPWFLSVMIYVVILFGVQTTVYAAEKEEWPKERGEILLVYDQSMDEASKKNIECIVNMASAMGKIIDYGDTQTCLSEIEAYEHIICYDLSASDTSFMKAFIRSKSNRLIIGSSFMKAYLKEKNQQQLLVSQEGQETGRLIYSFSENQKDEGLVTIKDFCVFQSKRYQNGKLQIGIKEYPYCYDVSDIRFIPITDLQKTLSQAALMQELQRWLWPYKDLPPDYAQYLVLDQVYPFMPAADLLQTVEQMVEAHIPFVISVMPLLSHGDYPSMKQFCQVLAYAQQHNGMIILHAPIIHKKINDIDELYKLLTDMTMPYIENGVYPMGIQVPISWTNHSIYQEVLKRYSTVFIYDDGQDAFFDMKQHTNNFCRQGHQQIWPILELDDTRVSKLRCYSSATYITISHKSEDLERLLENIKHSANPFMNLWNLEHSVWMNNFVMNYKEQQLYLNGERTEMTYIPEAYDKDYDFKRSALQKISVNLQKQNRVLIAIVTIVIILFTTFIVYGRIRTRKMFLGERDSKMDNRMDNKINKKMDL